MFQRKPEPVDENTSRLVSDPKLRKCIYFFFLEYCLNNEKVQAQIIQLKRIFLTLVIVDMSAIMFLSKRFISLGMATR